MAFNANLNFRSANNEAYKAILREYERKDLLPINFPDILSSPPFRIMTLQRSRLRKYLGLDENNFNAVTYEEIASSDRYRLDRAAGLSLPLLPELALITDNVLVGDEQSETTLKAVQRMATHVSMMMQRSLCPVCQTLVENFTLQILTPCGHGLCSCCFSRLRANSRINGGRRININSFTTRDLGEGWAAIDYDEVRLNCPICREEIRRNVQCFF